MAEWTENSQQQQQQPTTTTTVITGYIINAI